MCIRDRNSWELAFTLLDKLELSRVRINVCLLYTSLLQFLQNAADKTTSRLHFLDFTRGFQFDHEILSTLLRLVLNSRPVSYTHLDVYKRQ